MLQIHNMNKRNQIVLAGALGILAYAGYLLLKRIATAEEISCSHNDFRSRFAAFGEDDTHGIEYYSVR